MTQAFEIQGRTYGSGKKSDGCYEGADGCRRVFVGGVMSFGERVMGVIDC